MNTQHQKPTLHMATRTVLRTLARLAPARRLALAAAAMLLVLGVRPVLAETPAEYQVQPGDVLAVSVWREVDLQLDVLVRPDGNFSMPLAGDVPAVGKTVAQLATEVAAKLERYIPDPEVSVSVREVRGNIFYVIGKVTRPGQYLLAGNMHVMQALSLAGGMTPFARENKISILRNGKNGQQSIPFRYGDVVAGKNLEQNIALRTGDVVVVP